MPSNEFRSEFFKGMLEDCYRYHDNNTDILRFDVPPRNIDEQVKGQMIRLANKRGYARRFFSTSQAAFELTQISLQIEALEYVYSLLSDEESKRTLVELLRFRVLGPRHVKLARNNAQFWEFYNSIDRVYLKAHKTFQTSNDWYLNRYQVPGEKGLITLHAHPLNILAILLKQYVYHTGHIIVKAEPGEVVIDGGGCWGDSALSFADMVGTKGRVYTFEFVPANLEILQSNLALNSDIAKTIRIVPQALWNQSGLTMNYEGIGPGVSLRSEAEEHLAQTQTVSLDIFAREEKLTQIDLIKLDIEGAEMDALQGATEVLREFRPKLAIALYHKPDDLVTIPVYLRNLDLGYEFFLDHYSIHNEETILFARPRA